MSKKKIPQKKMIKRSTTGAPAGVNPSGGPGTGTMLNAKSTSTGNAGTGAGAAGGEACRRPRPRLRCRPEARWQGRASRSCA
ncbi:MAG TPA: hypothetical protein VN655_13325 [Pseudolabrys sp.]|nr:hypothetical protein [Pseudolabrys sp.]